MKIFIYESTNTDKKYQKLKNDYINRISKYIDISITKQIPKKDEKTYYVKIYNCSNKIDSIDFSVKLSNIFTSGYSNIFFAIDEIQEDNLEFDYSLNLCSDFVSTDMSLILLVEQIYRSFKINNGEIYHK